MGSPKKPEESSEDIALKQYQLEEINKLKKIEQQKFAALARGRLGRSMLASGDLRGVIPGVKRDTTKHKAILPEYAEPTEGTSGIIPKDIKRASRYLRKGGMLT